MNSALAWNMAVLVFYGVTLIGEFLDPITTLVLTTALSIQVSGAGNVKHISDVLATMANPVLYVLGALALVSYLFTYTRLAYDLRRLLLSSNAHSMFILLTIILSSILNNALVVSSLIPIVQAYAIKRSEHSAPLLITLSFSSMLAGTVTLLGSSTNLVAASLLEPEIELGLFALAIPALVTALVGSLYLLYIVPILLGSYCKPASTQTKTCMGSPPVELRVHLNFLEIAATSPTIGHSIRDAGIQEVAGSQLCGIQRGDTFLVAPPRSYTILQAGDRLTYVTTSHSHHIPQDILSQKQFIEVSDLEEAPTIACGVVPRQGLWGLGGGNSNIHQKTVAELDLKTNYGLILLGIVRDDNMIQAGLSSEQFRSGDLIVVYGNYKVSHQLQKICHRVHLLSEPIPLDSETLNPSRPSHSIDLVLLFALAYLVCSDQIEILNMNLAGLAILTLLPCTPWLSHSETTRAFQSYQSVLIGTMASLGLSASLEATGFSVYFAPYLESLWALPLWPLLFSFHMLSSMCSLLLSNAAVVSILIPVIKRLAMGDLPKLRPVALAVIHGASCCFASPTGYHTNLMIHHIGGLRCRDFLRVGLPLHILTSVVYSGYITSFM